MTAIPSHELLFSAYEEDRVDRQQRIVYPHNDATEVITDRFRQLKAEGAYITLVDGAFDVPHPNHEWYLRHCRFIGAAAMLESQGENPSTPNIKAVLGSNALKLAVTVDADFKINYKKGGKAEKGGVSRPIYPWEARAERIGGYMFNSTQGYRPVVDLVTVEGDDIHEGTALESSLTLASHLKNRELLDLLVVFGEHGQTVDEATDRGLEPYVIASGQQYTLNPQTGADWSSSGIIRHAQGQKVPRPITRPEVSSYATPLASAAHI